MSYIRILVASQSLTQGDMFILHGQTQMLCFEYFASNGAFCSYTTEDGASATTWIAPYMLPLEVWLVKEPASISGLEGS